MDGDIKFVRYIVICLICIAFLYRVSEITEDLHSIAHSLQQQEQRK